MNFTAYIPFIVIIVILVFNTIKILNEYERAVVFRLGRFTSVRGPGLIILVPGLEKMRRVDLRTVTMDIPSQDIISRDNVTLKVNGVVYFRVSDPEKSIIAVEDYLADLRESVDYAKAHPELKNEGNAAMYGMVAKIPARGMIQKELMKLMEDMYGPEGKMPDNEADDGEVDLVSKIAQIYVNVAEKVEAIFK